MATWNDVRRYALALPETVEEAQRGSRSWKVKDGSKRRSFVWERPLGKSDLKALGADAPNGPILGVRVADLEMKEAILSSNPRVYFTTPHFDGYPAVLVQLHRISLKELKRLMCEAWLICASEKAADAFLASKPG